MIKKTSIILLCFILTFSLTSCKSIATSGSGQDYLISSIGFTNINGKFQVILEAVIVNSEDPDAERNVKLVKGTGYNCKKAFAMAEEHTVQAMTLSHCATCVIDRNITPHQLKEIYEFLYDTDLLSLSMVLISCDDTEQLLSCKPTSSIAMGYDILGYLERLEKRTGTVYLNRLYNISAKREEPYLKTDLPYLAIKKGEFFLSGLDVCFQNDRLHLSNDEAIISSLISENQNSGSIILDEKVYKCPKITCKYNFSQITNKILILNISVNNSELAKVLPERILNLYSLSKELKLDIFSIYNTLYHQNKKLWEENSDSLYDLSLKVNIIS